MSLSAYIWASGLPLDAAGPTAFRVLLKYADRVDERGRAAWWVLPELAEELGCSTRTVQRAVGELLHAGLIAEGDQRFVQHIRRDRRPIVYDLILDTVPRGHGVTATDTPHGVTNLSRGDNSRPNGVTTGVALRTVKELTTNTTTSVSTERGDKSVTPSRPIYGVQPAPHIPPFQPEPQRAAVTLTLAERAAQASAENIPCPRGTGDTPGHKFPGMSLICGRCGEDASYLVAPALIECEATL